VINREAPRAEASSPRDETFNSFLEYLSEGHIFPLCHLPWTWVGEHHTLFAIYDAGMRYANSLDRDWRQTRLLNCLPDEAECLFQNALAAFVHFIASLNFVQDISVDVSDHDAQEERPKIDTYEIRGVFANLKGNGRRPRWDLAGSASTTSPLLIRRCTMVVIEAGLRPACRASSSRELFTPE
jgi:hypothetical protein